MLATMESARDGQRAALMVRVENADRFFAKRALGAAVLGGSAVLFEKNRHF
jgi:hypothetical protein